MGIEEIGDMDATAQAALVATGECSAAELLEATIEGIERVNPQLNAVIIPLFDRRATRSPAAISATVRSEACLSLLKDLGAALGARPSTAAPRCCATARGCHPTTASSPPGSVAPDS